jgi:hypothetical protein
MAEARAAVNTLRVGTLSLEQVTSAAKLRGVQVMESRLQFLGERILVNYTYDSLIGLSCFRFTALMEVFLS